LDSLSPEMETPARSTEGFRCPKCGASSALLKPDPDPTGDIITLKCLSCASLMRLHRDTVSGSTDGDPGRPNGSI